MGIIRLSKPDYKYEELIISLGPIFPSKIWILPDDHRGRGDARKYDSIVFFAFFFTGLGAFLNSF